MPEFFLFFLWIKIEKLSYIHIREAFLLDCYLRDFVLKRKITLHTQRAHKSSRAQLLFGYAQMSWVLFLVSHPFCSIVVSPRAHWLSWSGGGKQGQMRHGGPVLKKARERGPKIGRTKSLTHAAPTHFARCTHMAQVVHGTRKQTWRTTRHQSTSSLLSTSERVALDPPLIASD